MKPILKIETPSNFPPEELHTMTESLKNTDVAKEYHIIAVIGTTDYYNFEIITASDIGLHKI